ncbi:MAG: FecR domain-containing protein [Chitinophagaceae bacterium]
MKGNRELDKFLISYLLNELNAEEQAFVEDRISSDDETRQHFEEIQNTWRLLAVKEELDKIDVSSEWKYFEQRIIREKQKLISIKKQEVLEEKVEDVVEEERIKGSFKSRRILVSIAIAASLLSLIVLIWNFSAGRQQRQQPVSRATTLKPDSYRAFVKHEINTSGKPKRVVLSDGSLIVLSNNSEVSYQEPFTGNTRDITLKGKADFKVAKDKSKPFTVYSLALATTAMGTHFTVSAFENAENIIVKLYEGKIVVKSVPSVVAKLENDYYLSSGQQLVYNNKKNIARLLNFNMKNPDLQDNNKNENFTDSIELPENIKGSWYMFNNQSLGQVLEQLKILYNTDIVYSKKQVHNMYFIGKFDKSDSLYTILYQIASLNNFKVTKKDNKFIITK